MAKAYILYNPYAGDGRFEEDLQVLQIVLDPEGKLSVMVFHGCGKCKTLRIFPSIFKGNHTKFHKYVDILQGDAITVEFESARALQIDGEVVPKVKSYTARRGRVAAQEAMVSTR